MRKFPMMLIAAVCVALLYAAAATAQTPDLDFDAKLQTSPAFKALKAEVAAMKTACPCMSGGQPKAATTPSGKSAKLVRKADGSCACQVCEDLNGDGIPDRCVEIPCDCSAIQTANQNVGYTAMPTVFASAPGGCVDQYGNSVPCGSSVSYATYGTGAPVMYSSDGGGYYMTRRQARRASRRGGFFGFGGGGCASCGG